MRLSRLFPLLQYRIGQVFLALRRLGLGSDRPSRTNVHLDWEVNGCWRAFTYVTGQRMRAQGVKLRGHPTPGEGGDWL